MIVSIFPDISSPVTFYIHSVKSYGVKVLNMALLSRISYPLLSYKK